MHLVAEQTQLWGFQSAREELRWPLAGFWATIAQDVLSHQLDKYDGVSSLYQSTQFPALFNFTLTAMFDARCINTGFFTLFCYDCHEKPYHITFYVFNSRLLSITVGTACWDSVSTFPNFSLCFFYPLRSRFLALLVWFPLFSRLVTRFTVSAFLTKAFYICFRVCFFSFGVVEDFCFSLFTCLLLLLFFCFCILHAMTRQKGRPFDLVTPYGWGEEYT